MFTVVTRRAAVTAALAGAIVLGSASLAPAAEPTRGAAAAPTKAQGKGEKVSRPDRGGSRRAAGIATTFDHTEHRGRTGGYELARTYADQALATSGRCAAYAGIEKTSDFLSRQGAKRPSPATPVLRALAPIYSFADWLVGHFYTTPCDLAKQLAKTASLVTAVAYWDGEVYHRVHIQKNSRDWGRVDLCHFAAHTYYRVRGQWYVMQTMNAHLPARGGWGDCRP